MHSTTRDGLLIAGGILAALFCLGGIGGLLADGDEDPAPTPQRVVDTPAATTMLPATPVTSTGPPAAPSTAAAVPTPTDPPAAPGPTGDPGEPTSEPEPGDVRDRYYANCADARRAGAAPLRRGRDDGYRRALDRDNDGIACD